MQDKFTLAAEIGWKQGWARAKRQRGGSVTLLNTRNVRPSESEWSSDTIISDNATDSKFVCYTVDPFQIVARNVP